MARRDLARLYFKVGREAEAEAEYERYRRAATKQRMQRAAREQTEKLVEQVMQMR